ncbi:GYD domain-containing protein [Pleurocapsales cyanobacterium LEGE 10410]|nr:GYD domain-containing protein [Pleurocapsales cyanobacterium LEGE 10410]
MAYYLIQGSYTPEAWADMVKNPQNRLEINRAIAENLGVTIVDGWLAFGEYDFVLIIQAADRISEAAFSLIGWAGGALKSIKTTPLMTWREGIEAMKKASAVTSEYKPPSK